jgi:hypothetical protein
VADDWRSTPCNVVVVAVGFGVERPSPGIHAYSYWDNEHFGQHTKGKSKKRVFISGIGDGGLIDVLRCRYQEFNHSTFASKVARERDLDPYKRRLLQIDLQIPVIGAEKYLLEAYEKLNIPADLAYKFGDLRTDTEISLNGPSDSPLSPNASILNRFVIWSLIRARQLTFLPGRISRGTITTKETGNGVDYWISQPQGDELRYDEVIIRHGPAGCLNELRDIDEAFQGIEESATKDRTRTQLYPDDFYEPPSVHSASPAPAPSDLGVISGMSRIPSESPMPPMYSSTAPSSFVQTTVSEGSNFIVHDLVQLQSAIEELRTEIEAHNYLQAQTAAARVEKLASRVDEALTPKLRVQAWRAVVDFELMRRERIIAEKRDYDLSRLDELIRRMENGQR